MTIKSLAARALSRALVRLPAPPPARPHVRVAVTAGLDRSRASGETVALDGHLVPAAHLFVGPGQHARLGVDRHRPGVRPGGGRVFRSTPSFPAVGRADGDRLPPSADRIATGRFGAEGMTNALVPLPAAAHTRPTASPNRRLPCVVVRDGTASMAGPKIDQSNAGMRELARLVRSDRLIAADAELALVAVAGGVKVEVPFTPAGSFDPPDLEPYGNTPLGDGLLTGLQLLSDRLAVYREHDLEHHVPWMLLITDGEENVDPRRFAAAGKLIRQLEAAEQLRFFAVGVDGADMNALQSLTTCRPYALRGLDFKALFAWLYRSLRSMTQSRPGEDARPEDPTGPRGFAQ